MKKGLIIVMVGLAVIIGVAVVTHLDLVGLFKRMHGM